MDADLEAIPQKKVLHNDKLLETPLFHFILDPFMRTMPSLRKHVSSFFSVRTLIIGYPLQTRLPLPGFISDVPFVKHLTFVTVGEVLLVIPFIVMLLAGISSTFIDPDVEGSGSVAAIPTYVAFLTASKSNSAFSFFLGIPFERMLSFHILSGYISVILGCFHFYVAYAFPDADSGDGESKDRRLDSNDSIYALTAQSPDLIKFAVDGNTNLSGTISILIMSAMLIFSLPRKFIFQAFYYFHIAGAIIIIVYLLIHDVGLIAVVGSWWAVDVFARIVIMAGCRYPKKARVRNLPGNLVELTIPKTSNFNYNAGQYVFLAVPGLSSFEWHPFSISSSPHMETVTITIRVLGNWTRRLRNLVEKKGEHDIGILLEGPYGSLSVDLFQGRYKMALLVSGGIGITPMQSVCNMLAYQNSIENSWKKVWFIWTVREYAIIEAMSESKSGNLPRGNFLSLVDNKEDRRKTKKVAVPSFSVDIGTSDNFSAINSTNLEHVHSIDQVCSNQDSFLSTTFYLSNKRNMPSSDKKPFVNAGRPDIPSIFREMKKAAVEAREGRIAVCVCGPAKLVEACKIASVKQSCREVIFDIHSEKFDF